MAQDNGQDLLDVIIQNQKLILETLSVVTDHLEDIEEKIHDLSNAADNEGFGISQES